MNLDFPLFDIDIHDSLLIRQGVNLVPVFLSLLKGIADNALLFQLYLGVFRLQMYIQFGRLVG
jgi:hypothetical protein